MGHGSAAELSVSHTAVTLMGKQLQWWHFPNSLGSVSEAPW